MNWRRNRYRSQESAPKAFGGKAVRSQKYLCFCLVLFCASLSFASPSNEFKTANALYDEGKFAEAISVYEKIEPKTAHVFYNLGNAHFRANQLGKAILNYERARRLSPRDPDVLANLKFAQERLRVDAINTSPRAITRFAETVFFSRTLNNWSAYVVVAMWLTCLAVGLSIWVRQARTVFICVSVCLFLWFAFTSSALAYPQTQQRAAPKAIVLASNTEARFAPLADATVHFKLAEGTKVSVRDNRGPWLLIERADGQQGWIKSEAAERIGLY